jgi:hypothetical protein
MTAPPEPARTAMTSDRPTDLLAVAGRYADPAGWPVPLRFDPEHRW